MPVVGGEGEAPADLNHKCVPYCICCRTRFKMDTCFLTVSVIIVDACIAMHVGSAGASPSHDNFEISEQPKANSISGGLAVFS